MHADVLCSCRLLTHRVHNAAVLMYCRTARDLDSYMFKDKEAGQKHLDLDLEDYFKKKKSGEKAAAAGGAATVEAAAAPADA